jgi:predicted ATPase/class 3 adenylate cyclase
MTERVAVPPARPDLPTGTVTFLFTDVEGSTRLVQALGDQYPELLAAHDAFMRGAIREHGGVEVSTEGDAFFAVFDSPQAAVSAVVAAQRALSACTTWPGHATVRVRMGLHTGEGRHGGDNYVGIDVHRAARIAAAAHGGQVLLSEATRAMIEGSEPPGVGLRELGPFRLKDLDEPMRLHQLAIDGLEADYPPPRARRLGSLPTPRTSFVGREAVLGELRELLPTTRLLLLAGPGGAGKTRLGLELARSVADEYADGAFFVPLEAITDSQLVASAILQSLDVPPGSRHAEETLRETLAPMRVLLVLDNLEQIPGAGGVVDDLLQTAPGLKVVATSRVALRVYGEQEYHVPPLSLPDTAQAPEALAGYEGVALFVERARASRPDFRLTDANAPSVAEICRRLDGLPLAIELAAARIRMLGPEAILVRLDKRLRLLENQAPNLPARQRSMRGAIEWSYALLNESEQRLLDRLSVFAGGWDLAAAEAVCDPAGELGLDMLDGIGSLLDKSLVNRREEAVEPRFTMLQTIQEYGRERLVASGELDAVARRHAEYLRGIVESAEPGFVGADPKACVARIAPDQDNIRAALSWSIEQDEGQVGLRIAAAVWRLWQLRGQLAEGRRFLDALLDLPSAAEPTATRAQALTASGSIMYWQGDPAAGERYREALSVFESLGDEAGIAESLSNIGFVHLTAKPPDPAQAQRYFLDSLRRYEALGDVRMVASLTGSVGFTKMALGQPAEARETIERALELNIAGGYRGRAADNRFALGNIYRRMGEFAESGVMYRTALRETIEMDDQGRQLTFLSGVASWASEAGRLGEAVRLDGALRRAASERGGSLSRAPGIIDPVAAAREAGLGEEEIAAELAAGEQLGLDQAVALAFELLG